MFLLCVWQLTQLVAGIHVTYRGYTARGEVCPARARARWRLLGHSWSLRPVESWPALIEYGDLIYNCP